ncbi:MAG: hypothetical protein RL701_5751 [Pseudomonadota bacterium]
MVCHSKAVLQASLLFWAGCASDAAPSQDHERAAIEAFGVYTQTLGDADEHSEPGEAYTPELTAQPATEPSDPYAFVQSQCPKGSADADQDGLCNAAEAAYGTDPNNVDTDADFLNDAVEVYGSWTADGRHVDMPGFGAKPLRRDIFLELDYLPGYAPLQSAMDLVVQAFANAPVTNPDKSTGIALHVRLDQEVSAQDAAANAVIASWSQLERLKQTYFDAQLVWYFHYALFGNRLMTTTGRTSGVSSGIPGQSLLVTLGGLRPKTDLELAYHQAGTLMHELGHNLGLHHGGHVYARDGRLVADDTAFKANYLSVMNYNYQTKPFRMNGVYRFDYARFEIASLTENQLDEHAGLTPMGTTTRDDLAQIDGIRFMHEPAKGEATLVGGWASYQLDFNGDGSISAGNVAVDLDGNGLNTDTFAAQASDWANLQFNGLGLVNSSANFDATSELRPTPMQ